MTVCAFIFRQTLKVLGEDNGKRQQYLNLQDISTETPVTVVQ